MADKKDMKKKNMSSSSVLVQLYQNRKVSTKVDNMLDEGKTYDYIIEFCKEHGLSISKASLTNYKKKREESLETGVPLLQLLDKRAKDNVTYIKDREVESLTKEPKQEKTSSSQAQVHDISKVDKVYSDIEFLDEIIQKSRKGVKQFDVLDTPLGMKAVELKAKITGNQLNGLTIAGLRELKLRQQAKESALIEVVMKYVPEEQQDQLFADLEQAEADFFENLDLTAEEQRISQAIRASGIDL